MNRQLRVLVAGLALILLTNAVALIGVSYNRSGDPEAVIELTERELVLPYDYGFDKENSGIALWLNWRTGADKFGRNYYDPEESTLWLTAEKLKQLGFDIGEPPTTPEARRRYAKMLPREAYLVLEYDGDVYRRVLEKCQAELAEAQGLMDANPDKEEFKKRIEAARDRLEGERRHNSRLFIVDAGLDKDELRVRYAERSRYIIMSGQVDLQVIGKAGEYSLHGMVRGLDIDAVNVPLTYLAMLEAFQNDTRSLEDRKGPRYAVRLALGRRLEPWVMDVSPLN